MLKGEPENDSRKPRDLLKNRHGDSLKKSQRMCADNYDEESTMQQQH
jgi:hypothetical protein